MSKALPEITNPQLIPPEWQPDSNIERFRPTAVRGRLFLVGCERSGTTLLQAMLAQNSRVFSFPESHFFCRIVPRRALYRRLGIANPKTAVPVVRELANRCLGSSAPTRGVFGTNLLLRSYGTTFTQLVDGSALSAGNDVWIEKTPHHLYHIEAIASLVPAAKFIHILRDGRDVTASIRDASQKDNDYWGDWSAEVLADHWNQAVTESNKYVGRPRHCFLSYEDLIADPIRQLERVCSFAGITFEPNMLRPWESADQVTGWMSSRPWMEKTHEPVQDTRLKKYWQVFTDGERRFLETHLLGGGPVAASSTPAPVRVATEVA